MRNDYGPLIEEESKVSVTPPKLPVNKKLRGANQNRLSKNFRKPLPRISIKRSAKSESNKEMNEKRLKQDESAQSSSSVVNDAKEKPRYSKRKQSVIIQDNQSMECSQAEESSVASNAEENTEPMSKTPRTEQTEQAVSSPIKDVNKRTEVINIDDKDMSQRVKKPDQNNSMSQANSSSNTTAEAKTSTAAEQSTQPIQCNHQEHIPDRSSLSSFQPQIEKVRSLENVDDHKLLVSEVTSDKLCTSHYGLDSLKMSAHLYSHMNGARRLIPIQKPVEKRLRPIKMQRNLAIAAQNKSNSSNQIRQLSTRLVEQPPVVNQNQSQNDAQVSRTHIGNSRDQTAPNSSIGMIPQEIHRPNLIRQALSTTHNNFLSNYPQQQARMSPRSTGDKNVDLTTSPPNIITSETSDRQDTEMPSRPIYQSPRIQHTTAHENGYQNLCTEEQLVDQSTRTNSMIKRVHFMNDAASSPVSGNHINVTDSACQMDECMVDETLSPYNAVTSYSDTVTDHDVISDHEMSTDESPVETMNNVYGSANDSDRGTADKLTAAQNSTAETYKKLLEAVEQFNTAGNAVSNASSSRNLTPEDPRAPEETHTKVTESGSSNQNQHNNTNNTPKKNHKLYRFVIPAEYDAYDTRWTLKYRKSLPGLIELMPQSRVYVSYGELEYCHQVSSDCKTLARLLLPEVFNRNALSVCSSMKEKAYNKVSSIIRPDLDVHACSVLLKFVLEHGLLRGWNTDLEHILSTLHSKMLEIRFKYGVRTREEK